MDELKGIKQPFMFRPFLGEEHGRVKGHFKQPFMLRPFGFFAPNFFILFDQKDISSNSKRKT